MEESTSREKVLKSVREALISKTDQPFPKIDMEKPVYRGIEDSPDINFAKELTEAGGNFIYCADEEEFIQGLRFLIHDRQWGNVYALEPNIARMLGDAQVPYHNLPDGITNARVGVTGCEYLISRLGSILVSSGQMAGRRIFVYPEIHVVLAYTNQLAVDLKEAFAGLRKKYDTRMPSVVSLITGPSRTADIEKTLVIGAHGPKELYVFMVEHSPKT